MGLLTDRWIPIQQSGVVEKITLGQLLCGDKDGSICLPRDDLEMACLQLLCAITQILFTPENKKALIGRIREPLAADEYQMAIADKLDWFDIEHPKTPFMQMRGVKSASPTPMDKLLPGVADGTNKAFVNPSGMADGLCSSCVAIALFNMANNAPSMGGGFKGGLRGSTPITILLKGRTLRETLWLNVLSAESIVKNMPWYWETLEQKPNYVDPATAGSKFSAASIGLARGLLWQPAHFELLPPKVTAPCSCCGVTADIYTGFNKAKFNYTIEGVWPHPLSSRIFTVKKGQKEEKFPSFTTTAPAWTHMSKLLVSKQSEKEGQQPAPIILQAQQIMPAERINILVGGYRNNQATVLERCHELFSLAEGWGEKSPVVDRIVSTGLSYKTALRRALYLFSEGVKGKIKGAGVNLYVSSESKYYQQTEMLIHNTVASIDFYEPVSTLDYLHWQLKRSVNSLFEEVTEPYQQEPKMLKALAVARRSLSKSLSELEPQEQGHSHEPS